MLTTSSVAVDINCNFSGKVVPVVDALTRVVNGSNIDETRLDYNGSWLKMFERSK